MVEGCCQLYFREEKSLSGLNMAMQIAPGDDLSECFLAGEPLLPLGVSALYFCFSALITAERSSDGNNRLVPPTSTLLRASMSLAQRCPLSLDPLLQYSLLQSSNDLVTVTCQKDLGFENSADCLSIADPDGPLTSGSIAFGLSRFIRI